MQQEIAVINIVIEGPKLAELNIEALAETINLALKGESITQADASERRTCDGIDIMGRICIGRSSR